VAYDASISDYRHYRVDRISNLTVLEEARGDLPPHFDLGEYTRTTFDMYNGESRRVTLWMEEKLLNIAIDRFGADAHMRAVDGGIEVSAEVEAGPTFYGWLFQFGPQAKLLAPQSAVEDFKQWCRDTLKQYE
jgi:predicted DNA-binding transcriptional regulator YafY